MGGPNNQVLALTEHTSFLSLKHALVKPVKQHEECFRTFTSGLSDEILEEIQDKQIQEFSLGCTLIDDIIQHQTFQKEGVLGQFRTSYKGLLKDHFLNGYSVLKL